MVNERKQRLRNHTGKPAGGKPVPQMTASQEKIISLYRETPFFSGLDAANESFIFFRYGNNLQMFETFPCQQYFLEKHHNTITIIKQTLLHPTTGNLLFGIICKNHRGLEFHPKATPVSRIRHSGIHKE